MKKIYLNRVKLVLDVYFECVKSINWLFPLHIASKLLLASCPLANIYLFSMLLQSLLKTPIETNKVFFLMALFILIIFVSQVVTMFNNLIETQITLKITQHTHMLFNNLVSSFPLSYIDSPKGKNDIQLMLASYDFYRNIYYGVVNFVNCLYTFIASFYMLIIYNSWYALLTALLVLPVIVFSYKNQKDDDDLEVKQMPIRAVKDNYMNMLISERYAMDVRLYNVQEIFIDKYLDLAEKIHNLYKFNYKKRLNLGLIFHSIMITGQIVLMCHLLNQTYLGIITVAELSKILGYITSAISIMISCGTVITDIITKSLWIEEYSLAKYENKIQHNISKGINISELQSIEFDNVWFRYPGTTLDILKGISFRVDTGEKISIVGVNGAGKTTCIKLLLGIYKPDKGNILINNIPANQYSEETLHNLFSCVFQNYIIYPFSLRENINFGSSYDSKSNNDLDFALRSSGCIKFVNSLKNDVNTFLSRRYSSEGAELSKGQKQSVVIARAIQKKAPVLIFDEPSSALDAENENELLKVFEGLNHKQIGILISHRLSSATVSDRIIVLDNGIIKEIGNHTDLINQGGMYSQMYLTQKKQYGEC